jgi:hypothetical protein
VAWRCLGYVGYVAVANLITSDAHRIIMTSSADKLVTIMVSISRFQQVIYTLPPITPAPQIGTTLPPTFTPFTHHF